MKTLFIFPHGDFEENALDVVSVSVPSPVVGISALGVVSIVSDYPVYYTTNGATPTTNSTLYSGSFTIAYGTTVKAVAYNIGMHSPVVSETFNTYQITRLSHILSNGNFVIDTGITAKASYNYDVSWVDNEALNSSNSLVAVGASENTTTNMFVVRKQNSMIGIYNHNSNTNYENGLTYSQTFSVGSLFRAVINGTTATLYINGTQKKTGSTIANQGTAGATTSLSIALYNFKTPTKYGTSTVTSTGSFYVKEFIIKNTSDVEIYHFVPAINDTTGKIGFYDTINDNFIAITPFSTDAITYYTTDNEAITYTPSSEDVVSNL